jgi:hypothetical protein
VESDEAFSEGIVGYTQSILCRLLGQYCSLSETKENDSKAPNAAEWGGWGPWNYAIEVAFFKNKFSRVVHIICTILKTIKFLGLTTPCLPYITQVARLYGKSCVEVSLVARQMLIDVRSDSFLDREANLLRELTDIAIGSRVTEEGKQLSEVQLKALGRRDSSDNPHGGVYQSIRLDQDAQTRMHYMITSPEPLFDILLSIMTTDVPSNILQAAMELYIQRAYRAYRLKTLEFIDPPSISANKVFGETLPRFFLSPSQLSFLPSGYLVVTFLDRP